MTRRSVDFTETAWHITQALPRHLGWAVERTAFQLLDNPVPAIAEPFPESDPLPGAYELHLPSDQITIWYVIVPRGDREIIMIQHVEADT